MPSPLTAVFIYTIDGSQCPRDSNQRPSRRQNQGTVQSTQYKDFFDIGGAGEPPSKQSVNTDETEREPSKELKI